MSREKKMAMMWKLAEIKASLRANNKRIDKVIKSLRGKDNETD